MITLSKRLEYFEVHPDAVFVYSNCEMIGKNGNYLYTYHFPKFKFSNYIVLNWSYIPQPTTFWRRIIHEKLGDFDVSFKMAGDFEFFARIGKHFKIDKLDLNLSKFRLHNSSLTSSYKNINHNEVLRIHDMYRINANLLKELKRIIFEVYIKILNINIYFKRIYFKWVQLK